MSAVSSGVDAPSQFSQFTPRPSRKGTLDYDVWDKLLKEMVFYSGPSLRKSAPRPAYYTGTRIAHGHTSPFRLEGNKVVFEGMEEEFGEVIDLYVGDLVDIANRIDLAAFPRNEQLAFWLNLHNLLAIKAIKDEYPMSRPSASRGPDGLQFHDSKRITIRGVPLSLRDIRENIVYANWENPNVIYGFFYGDIGGPSIQRAAFTSKNVSGLLKFIGEEYANSMRGYHSANETARVSQLYKDAAPWFFPNFEIDVKAHLRTLQRPEIQKDMRQTSGPIRLIAYDKAIVDLTKGQPDWKPYSQVQTDGSLIVNPLMARAMREQAEKFQELRQRGMTGTVVIEDLETTDPEDRGGDEVE